MARTGQTDRNPKYQRRLAIGIVLWVIVMFLFLLFAIVVDWH
ncbi:MAG: hypothetical protein ABI778_08045 [Ignavibacteriota bacterium]